MKAPDEKPSVSLTGEEGNAFTIMSIVSKALRKAGADGEFIKQYLDESKAGDYKNVLITAMKYVNVE